MGVCIVVSGPPCAGKSTLARAVAAASGWPLLAKDEYKERIFDALGTGERDWSRRVSGLAWELLIAEAGRLRGAGASCIVEGNLREPQRAALRALAHAAPFVEVQVRAAPEVLLARYRERAAAGVRHPGHVDLEALPEIEAELAARCPPLSPFGGPVLDWDTTERVDGAALIDALGAVLAPFSAPGSGTPG